MTAFYNGWLLDYSMFNPHATFTLAESGEAQRFDRTASEWTKWLPSDPTSPHWYNVERLENLIASYVAPEPAGGRVRTVREFVVEFRGLSGTAKQKQVTAEAGLERASLHDLVTASGQFNHAAVARLLAAMQRLSAPVKPDALGILGEQHFRERIGKVDEVDPVDTCFRYKRITGIDDDGLPYVVECAFSITSDLCLQGTHIGLNWSVPLSNPLKENTFTSPEDGPVWGLGGLLESARIDLDDDPICLALHLTGPLRRATAPQWANGGHSGEHPGFGTDTPEPALFRRSRRCRSRLLGDLPRP